MNLEDLELPADGEDDEFGEPETIPVDQMAQVNHALMSFAQQNMQAQWKIGQHAAEIEALKLALGEKDSELRAERQVSARLLEKNLALESENARLEAALERRTLPEELQPAGALSPADT